MPFGTDVSARVQLDVPGSARIGRAAGKPGPDRGDRSIIAENL
jgi:hypothetical protein